MNQVPFHGSGKSILITTDRDTLLTEYAKKILSDRYMLDGETSPQEVFARAACAYGSSNAHSQRLYDYASLLWFGFASPLLANGGTKRGTGISCFLSHIDDSIEDLCDKSTERKYMSVNGGAIGSNVSLIRPSNSPIRGGEISSPGMIPHLKEMESDILAYLQGRVRRGSVAAFCDISHPEIEQFLNIRRANGDTNIKCLSEAFHHGVNLTDAFMEAVKNDSQWNLIDPNTKKVTKSLNARELWLNILTTRIETGEPYLHFIDNSNKALPQQLKDKGYLINNTNLCTEIFLPTSKDRSAVCCLSSLNLEKWDEWSEDLIFIQDIMEMLDNVLEDFIKTAPKQLQRAINSALNERSVGLGVMGWHSFLQSKNLPFDCSMAISWNKRIFEHIYDKALLANIIIGENRGEAPDMLGTGKRFSHMIAIAPTATNADICGGTSASVEPWLANAFTRKTLSGSSLYKNKYLERELAKIGQNTKEVWSTIIENEGSIQHLLLPTDIKDVFKTAQELDQQWIIEHAAARQPYVCQGQSLNLFFSPDCDIKYLHTVHWQAWEKGLKSLYYLRPIAINRAVTSYKEGCISCEG